MNNLVTIKLNYNDLRSLLIDVYKSAVNSYEELADFVVDQKLSDYISDNYKKNIGNIDFSLQKFTDSNIDLPVQNSSQSTVITTQINESTSFTYYSSDNTILNSETNNLGLTFTSTG